MKGVRNKRKSAIKRRERRLKKQQAEQAKLNKVEKDVQDVVLNVSDKIPSEPTKVRPEPTIPVVDSKGNTIETPESQAGSFWKIIGVLAIPFVIGGAVAALMYPFI